MGEQNAAAQQQQRRHSTTALPEFWDTEYEDEFTRLGSAEYGAAVTRGRARPTTSGSCRASTSRRGPSKASTSSAPPPGSTSGDGGRQILITVCIYTQGDQSYFFLSNTSLGLFPYFLILLSFFGLN